MQILCLVTHREINDQEKRGAYHSQTHQKGLGENWALIFNSSQTEQNMKHNSKILVFSASHQQLHPEKFRPK